MSMQHVYHGYKHLSKTSPVIKLIQCNIMPVMYWAIIFNCVAIKLFICSGVTIETKTCTYVSKPIVWWLLPNI